jgi:serine/threonine protein kinase
VVKIIGKGTFARVYYAKHNDTGKLYAIKAMVKERILTDNSKGIICVWNEIQIMRALGKNDHLMDFYEIHETENSIYMVVEYFPGKELFKRMAKKKVITE